MLDSLPEERNLATVKHSGYPSLREASILKQKAARFPVAVLVATRQLCIFQGIIYLGTDRLIAASAIRQSNQRGRFTVIRYRRRQAAKVEYSLLARQGLCALIIVNQLRQFLFRKRSKVTFQPAFVITIAFNTVNKEAGLNTRALFSRLIAA